MQNYTSQIDYYIQMYRRDGTDDAFHGLLEFDRGILPELINVFRSTSEVEIQELLVEVIWNYRDDSVIPFLGELLRDSEPRVWRKALDGLVALASPATLTILQCARSHQLSTKRETDGFQLWLEEAIQQVKETIS